MIRKLRRQFNRITILMLILVLLIPLIGVNLLTRFVSYQQTDTLLQQIAESSSYGLPEAKPPFEQAQKNPQEPANPPAPPNDDKKEEPAPPPATNDKFFERDHKRPIDVLNDFTIYLNADGTFLSVSDPEQCNETEAQVLLEAVQKESSNSGYIGSYQYYRKIRTNGTLIVFSDRTSDLQLLTKLLWFSIGIGLCMVMLIIYLTNRLSKRAVRPIEIAFEQQRQFISDAGHELKTPLTIITTNADILHDEIGENKWLSYIQDQAERMRILITDMMRLTKLERPADAQDQVEFDLSKLVENTALPFESQAFESRKELEIEVEDGLTYRGNAEEIRQMVGIFLDNAFKYSEEKGTVRITLQKNKDKKLLKIYNTGIGIRPDEKEKIFLRFYRSDHSRARATGGYGLGLSIAKRIADKHKIKIQVESEEGKWACFLLTL